jgi:hypothetical protein
MTLQTTINVVLLVSVLLISSVIIGLATASDPEASNLTDCRLVDVGPMFHVKGVPVRIVNASEVAGR